jgi:Family of unknown function (DUF6370)
MKKASVLFSAVAGLVLLAAATPSFAADSGSETERTIKGEAKCAKCLLKESDKCQTVIEAKGNNGRTVKYYVTDNEVAKKFHDEVCQEAKKVTAVGTVKRVDGKRELTLTKIELAKDSKDEKETK